MTEYDETDSNRSPEPTADQTAPRSTPRDDTPRDDVAWWSQPGAGHTAVLEQDADGTPRAHSAHDAHEAHDGPTGYPVVDPTGVVPPEQPPHGGGTRDRGGRGRRGLAALGLALALVVAGGIGGAVEHGLDGNDTTTGVLTTSGSGGGVTQNTSTTAGGSGTAPAGVGTPQSAAATISPSVVTIEVSGTTTTTGNGGGFFGGGQSQTQQVADTGSGVVIRSDGYVLTNNHVVAAAENGQGTVHVTLAGGKTVSASIVGSDATSDLAVVKLADTTGLTAAVFANSDKLAVGQSVIAVGAPLGLSNTVTQGIVSTVHRPTSTGEAGASVQSVLDAIQTDAAINPGNSGGALVDLSGQVVGIPSAIATTGTSSDSSAQSGNIGVGFAIPSNDAAKVADQLIASGKAVHAQIGISAGDQTSSTTGAPGLGSVVKAVTSGGPADKAGLKVNDVITKVGDRVVTDADSLIVAIRSNDPGSKVAITYTRGGQTMTTTATLGSSG